MKKHFKDKNKFIELIKSLYPYDYAVNGDGNTESYKILKKELNFKVHQFKEKKELNGWVVPRNQIVKKAIIKSGEKIILDHSNEPLGLILCCSPFKGKVSLKKLKNHLFYHSVDSNAIPFHCIKQYNQHKIDWGFCVPKNFYKSLNKNSYDIDIQINYKKSNMKVFEYSLKGKSKKTIVIQAHNCHPYQANDDLSGIAVAIRLMQYLKNKKNYYTYKIIISPELTGTIFWLNKINSKEIIASIILPACGNKNSLKLQETFTSNTFLDSAAHDIFKKKYKKYSYGKFRTIYGNDETVFEAPGYEIPSISITRYPYKEYHTNKDTLDVISLPHINDTLDTIKKLIKILDKQKIYKFNKRGLFCLSNKKYNLYVNAWDPSNRNGPKNRDDNRKWYRVMTELPRLLNGKNSLSYLARYFDVNAIELDKYLQKWLKKKLVELY